MQFCDFGASFQEDGLSFHHRRRREDRTRLLSFISSEVYDEKKGSVMIISDPF